jgi:hypothetical protein
MQKFICLEASPDKSNELDELNLLLEQGWHIIEEEINKPRDGKGFHLLIRLQEPSCAVEDIAKAIEEMKTEKKQRVQKIIDVLKKFGVHSDEVENEVRAILDK